MVARKAISIGSERDTRYDNESRFIILRGEIVRCVRAFRAYGEASRDDTILREVDDDSREGIIFTRISRENNGRNCFMKT